MLVAIIIALVVAVALVAANRYLGAIFAAENGDGPQNEG
jgi:hypothetical protein